MMLSFPTTCVFTVHNIKKKCDRPKTFLANHALWKQWKINTLTRMLPNGGKYNLSETYTRAMWIGTTHLSGYL